MVWSPSVSHQELSLLKEHLQTTHISRKQSAPSDDEKDLEKALDSEAILVPTLRDVIAFQAYAASSNEPHQPKIPTATAKSLAPLVKMVIKDAQSSVATLKSMKAAHSFLVDALKQSQIQLPAQLRKYEYPAHIEEDEKKLIRTMQFVLTDFAGKCDRQKENHDKNVELRTHLLNGSSCPFIPNMWGSNWSIIELSVV